MLTQMLKGAPTWVWIALGVIVARGVRALSERTVYVPSLFIVPAVLVAFKLAYGVENNMVLYYFIGLFVGIAVGFVKTQRQTRIEINKKRMEVTVPGSPQLLITLLTFFCIKYFFGYLEAMHIEIAFEYMWLENILTGSVIGYLWGNSASYLYRLLKA